jgi:mRNA interferase MazF
MKFGDIHWADLPDRKGTEQRGRRPVVIWQDTDAFSLPTALIIPFTTQRDTLRFPGTVLIQPSAANGLSAPSVALVFQLGASDTRRVRERIGHLEEADLALLREVAKKLQKLP